MHKLGLFALPLLLAEATFQGVPASSLGGWLINAAAAALLVRVLWDFADRVKGGAPQKREISFAESLATADEIKQAHGRISREREEIDRELGRVAAEVKELREKFDDTVRDLNARIDRVPERTINLLRETKDLI